MAKYKIFWPESDEYEDEEFDSYDEAEEMAVYYSGCARLGAEMLNLSNPGDYPYDADDFDEPDYEIVKVVD